MTDNILFDLGVEDEGVRRSEIDNPIRRQMCGEAGELEQRLPSWELIGHKDSYRRTNVVG